MEVYPKAKALADAGISTSAAHNYEQLTGGADARGEAAAKRAIEETLAKNRAERTPVTAKELLLAMSQREYRNIKTKNTHTHKVMQDF